MWQRVRTGLMNGTVLVLLFVWFVCAVAIARWLDGEFDISTGRRQRGTFATAIVIWLVPIGVVTAVNEFVIRRIRYGPPLPGRRKRLP